MSNNTNETDVFDNETLEQTERRRTIWIWIILGWACFALFGLIGIWKSILVPLTDIEFQQANQGLEQANQLLGTKIPQIPQKAHLDIITNGVIPSVIVVINFWAAWELFMLRFRAVKIYAVILAFGLANIAYSLIMVPNYLSLLKTPMGWFSLLLGQGIYIAVILYAIRLRRRGVLL